MNEEIQKRANVCYTNSTKKIIACSVSVIKVYLVKPAFIMVPMTTNPFHHPVFPLYQSRKRQLPSIVMVLIHVTVK
jgi:hypothetical protein